MLAHFYVIDFSCFEFGSFHCWFQGYQDEDVKKSGNKSKAQPVCSRDHILVTKSFYMVTVMILGSLPLQMNVQTIIFHINLSVLRLEIPPHATGLPLSQHCIQVKTAHFPPHRSNTGGKRTCIYCLKTNQSYSALYVPTA